MEKLTARCGNKRKKMYFCSLKRDVPVAQLVEQLTLNQWVQGSNPCGDTEKHSKPTIWGAFFISKSSMVTTISPSSRGSAAGIGASTSEAK